MDQRTLNLPLGPLYELLEQNYNAFEFAVPLPDSFCHFNRCLSMG